MPERRRLGRQTGPVSLPAALPNVIGGPLLAFTVSTIAYLHRANPEPRLLRRIAQTMPSICLCTGPSSTKCS
jgi:hypothetical protein